MYGLFSLALSVALLFVTVAAFGLPDGLLRYVPIYRQKKQYAKLSYLVREVKKILQSLEFSPL